MDTLNSLDEFIETLTERFKTPRRNEINEGFNKTDLLDSFIDLANFIHTSLQEVDQTVANLAAANALVLTLTRSAIINVVADESQGGISATYYWNKVSLQEILLL